MPSLQDSIPCVASVCYLKYHPYGIQTFVWSLGSIWTHKLTISSNLPSFTHLRNKWIYHIIIIDMREAMLRTGPVPMLLAVFFKIADVCQQVSILFQSQSPQFDLRPGQAPGLVIYTLCPLGAIGKSTHKSSLILRLFLSMPKVGKGWMAAFLPLPHHHVKLWHPMRV